MANGRVITGFSKPYVAKYATTENSGTIVLSYSNGQILARGVSVSMSVESSDDNNFYADNIIAETAAGSFGSGDLTLTVDGLLDAATKLILGLPAADGDGWTHYGDSMDIPYMGVGFVVRYMSGGSTSYVPVVLHKCKFSVPNIDAATQEDSIDFQTQELTAKILRDDTANHEWRVVGTAVTTETLAENAIKSYLSIS